MYKGTVTFLVLLATRALDAGHDAIGLLGHLGTLLAPIQRAVYWYLCVLFCWAAFQPPFPKLISLHGVVTTQVRDQALNLLECHVCNAVPGKEQGVGMQASEYFWSLVQRRGSLSWSWNSS